MKQINLIKYGFIRDINRDFSDDGTRFTTYRAGNNIKVTKAVCQGQVYIAASVAGNLGYSEYSSLPHYKKLAMLNGVNLSSLTEDDLKEFYNDCLAYEQEYKNLEKTIADPTVDKVIEQCKKINSIRRAEINHIDSILKQKISTILLNSNSEYDLKTIRNYYINLDKEILDLNHYSKIDLHSSYMRDFVSPENLKLKPSFWYKKLIEILNKYEV